MLNAAIKALKQMFSRPFRAVLVKSVGLALAFLIVLGIALDRAFAWLNSTGALSLESSWGMFVHWPVVVIGWILTIAVGIGLFAGAIFLMPAVTSLVASFFSDEIAEHVEREHYPADPAGGALPLARATIEGARTALLALIVYLCALPLLVFAGFGAVFFFLATAYLLGREYFELVAMRFHPVAEAKAIRRARRAEVFVAGLFIAAFVSIPIVNLATPLFGTAFMVHVYKRLAGGPRRELIEPMRAP
jgi:CysZ protein